MKQLLVCEVLPDVLRSGGAFSLNTLANATCYLGLVPFRKFPYRNLNLGVVLLDQRNGPDAVLESI